MDDNVELYQLLENEIFARTNHSATDLPPPNTKRWVARRKAVVVNAVRSGAISLEEVCRRYEKNSSRGSERSIPTGSRACE